ECGNGEFRAGHHRVRECDPGRRIARDLGKPERGPEPARHPQRDIGPDRAVLRSDEIPGADALGFVELVMDEQSGFDRPGESSGQAEGEEGFWQGFHGWSWVCAQADWEKRGDRSRGAVCRSGGRRTEGMGINRCPKPPASRRLRLEPDVVKYIRLHLKLL